MAFPQLAASSAIQMRLGGIKGMLFVHPNFPKEAADEGCDIVIHESMVKFNSNCLVRQPEIPLLLLLRLLQLALLSVMLLLLL